MQSRQEPRPITFGTNERRRGTETESPRPVQPLREVRQERGVSDPDAVRIAAPPQPIAPPVERLVTPIERRPEVRSDAPKEPVIRREEPRMVDGISGPSILGLNYAPTGAYAEKSSEGSTDYLLEDEPVERGVSWRAVALLLLIVVGGALGFMQWRSNHSPSDKPNLEKILSGKPSANGDAAKSQQATSDDQATISSPSDRDSAAKKDEQAAPGANTNPTNAQTNPAQQPTKDASAEQQNAQAQQTTPDGVTVKSGNGAGVTVNSDGQTKHGNAEDQSTKPESDETPDSPKPPDVRPKPKVAKFTDETTPISLGEKDPVYQQAMGFIQARGVPRDCQRGVRLMLQSANDDNSKAAIQLGAMYATGNCVVPDRVQAYRWFSRALAIDPQNRYVRKTRDSLWANMNDTERGQTGTGQ